MTEASVHVEFEKLSNRVIGCAIEVHRHLGPGLLESAYQKCLSHELKLQRIPFEAEKPLPVRYKGVDLECGYRIDFLIDSQLILELKAVDRVQPVHQAQILTYMKLAKIPVGLLMNFHVKRLKEGIKRFVI